MVRRVVGATLVFLAVLAVLKIAFALSPSRGLLRADGLFPLWALWERGTAWGWFVPAAACAVAAAVAWGTGAFDRVRAPAFVSWSVLLCFAAWCSLALTNSGFPSGLTAPFSGGEDYWSAVARFAGPGEIWSAWTARQAALPLHATTHPPGATALLEVLSRFCGGRATAVALWVVALGAAALLPLYAWGREMLGERAARRAVLLWAVAPATMLYGATCLDMVFALPLVTAAWLFHRAVSRDDTRAAVLSGLALGLALLFTFAAGVQALAFVLVAIGARKMRPLAITAVSSAFVLLAVRVITGFDWWASFREAARLDASLWPAWSSASYYVWTRLMGVFDPAIMFGAASFATWVGTLRRGVAGRPDAVRWGRATAAACVIALAAGAFKIGETGRILVFALPAVVLPVAARLEDDDVAVWLLAGFSLAQAFVFEAVLDTRW